MADTPQVRFELSRVLDDLDRGEPPGSPLPKRQARTPKCVLPCTALWSHSRLWTVTTPVLPRF
jgi:hypothetical protein